MNKVKIKRQSFSSPAQLQKMAMMVIARWHEVWPEAFLRHQNAQQGHKGAIQTLQKSLPKTSQG
jgi:hypothetical protein